MALYRSFNIQILIAVALLFSGISAFNFIVDPFQYYRVASIYRPILWGGMQRFQNAGLARNFAEDVVVVGSSVTENFLPSDIQKRWGKKATKLSISGSTSHEQFLVLRLALQTGQVKNVLWGLDTGAFYFPPNGVRDDQAPFPWHMYRVNALPNVEYLFGLGTLRLSVAALLGYGETNFDRYHAWFDQFEYGNRAVLKTWNGSCAEFEKKFVDLPPLSKPIRSRLDASVESNLLSLISAHPEVTFHLFLPPVATLIHVPAANRFLPVHLPFRDKIAETVLKHPNVRLHDFQTVDHIVDDLANFKDPLHFDLPTTHYIIDAVRDGRHLITSRDDMAEKNRHLIEMANRYDLCKSGILQAVR